MFARTFFPLKFQPTQFALILYLKSYSILFNKMTTKEAIQKTATDAKAGLAKVLLALKFLAHPDLLQ